MTPEALQLVQGFWARMVSEYADQWANKYGEWSETSPDVRNWAAKVTQIMLVMRKRHGSEPAANLAFKKRLEAALEQWPNYPPNPNSFKQFMVAQRHQAHKLFKIERLPKSTREDSERRAAEHIPRIRESLGGGKLTREEQNEIYNQLRKPVFNPAVGE